jgi:hypothetical protein
VLKLEMCLLFLLYRSDIFVKKSDIRKIKCRYYSINIQHVLKKSYRGRAEQECSNFILLLKIKTDIKIFELYRFARAKFVPVLVDGVYIYSFQFHVLKTGKI